MKYSQLSNFQKQQYTNYLETQLQKFSSFMLAQRRENEKYGIFESAIAYQSDIINQMQGRVELVELYQKQNHSSFEHLSKKISKIEDIQARLRRLEDRQRFGCDDQSNIKLKLQKEKPRNPSESEEQASRLVSIEQNYRECMKMMKRQQAELSDCQDALNKIRKKRTIQNTNHLINPEMAIDKKDLKKLQKKLVRYFNEKLEDVESSMHRRKSKSSKSRSAKECQLSIIDNYTIREPKKTISSFRMEDDMANKSQMSTILQSKSTKTSKVSEKGKKFIKKKRDLSKSRSKSKSKSVSKSKSHKGSKSRSKDNIRGKNVVNKSFSLSDESMIQSSKSRSKSRSKSPISKHPKSKSKDSMLSKHSKHSKKARKSQSKEKSLSSSHDLCKKRPQLTLNLLKKTPQLKRETLPLRKRKPVQLQRYK